MRILYTTSILEHPAVGGPQLRIENSIKALSRVCELDIIYRTPIPTEIVTRTSHYFESYASEYHVLFKPTSMGSFSRGLAFFEKVLNRLFGTRIIQQGKYILDHVERRQIDIIWFGYGNISYPLIKYIKSRRPDLKLICDTDSVWSRFVLRELPYASGLRKLQIQSTGRKKEKEEKAWVNLCQVTTAVSEVDGEYYKSIANDPGRIFLFSNVIDIESYRLVPPPPRGFKKPSIYLAGSFGHDNSSMNVAARWVLEDVLPRVLKVNPSVHFYIVGNHSEVGFGNLQNPSVTVTGRLDSVLPYLCNVDVALVPLKFESGTRFKILEAGSCKIPLVSTTLGAEGIPVVDAESILIADEAEDFADAIVRLIEDKELAKRLATNCHTLVNEHYSIDSLTAEVNEIFEYLNHD
jgi:glycosyltransferase involved in cell wall biosynthesis